MTPMRTNDEIRRLNMLIAMARFGSAAKLAERVGTSPAYLSQIKNRTPDSKSGTPKTMGDELARRIEAAAGEPAGWIDAPHQEDWEIAGIVQGAISTREPEQHYNGGPTKESGRRPGELLVEVPSSSETTLERLDANERRILDLYRVATSEGKIMILGAANVAPKDESLLAKGPN